MRIYLASRSPQRLRLLQQAGYEVEVVPPNVAEPPIEPFSSAEAYVLCTAWLKLCDVQARVAQGLIVAADTVASVERQILGKPADRREAERMLRQLSGSRHQVVTGLAICKMPEELYLGVVERTDLQMRALSEQELMDYLDSDRWEGKAGAYAIQEEIDPFIVDRQGSLSNVIGFPLERFHEILSRLPWLRETSQ